MSEYLYESQKKNFITQSPIERSKSNELNQEIFDCIVLDSRSFNDFKKSGMTRVLNKLIPGYKAQHPTTITRKLKKEYLAYRKKLKEMFEKFGEISLTTDVWKNKRLSYFLSLTGHFFDENFKLFSIMVAFRKI